ncbi:MAG: transposase [Myxococcales bacterium]
MAGCRTEADLVGPDGVFTKLKGAVMSQLLEAEITHHLGHERNAPRKGSNARNGHSRKTVHTETGNVVVSVATDRDGTFEPQLIGKHQRRLEEFDEKVLALYARGMTTRVISSHLRELYRIEVSHDLISKATEHVIDEFRAWQERPLEAVYPVINLDAIFVGVRDGAQVKKRASCHPAETAERTAIRWPGSATRCPPSAYGRCRLLRAAPLTAVNRSRSLTADS